MGRLRAGAVLLAAGLALAGCSGAGGDPQATPSPTAGKDVKTAGPQTARPAPRMITAKPGPSGAVMPVGNLPGWKQVFTDDFTGKGLDREWYAYSGQPGGDPDGWWEPSHVHVKDGMLKLRTEKVGDRWISGGVGAWNGRGLKYGKVEVRFRVPVARGVAYAFLLWPATGGWPPEIDFAEDGGGDRRTTSATLHYGKNDTRIARSVGADFTEWRTVGVEWTPGKLVYTLDGEPWDTVRSKGVPDERMVLALQTQVWGCHVRGYLCPDETTPLSSTLDVDWVVAYARAGD